jgi:hypothetical protein
VRGGGEGRFEMLDFDHPCPHRQAELGTGGTAVSVFETLREQVYLREVVERFSRVIDSKRALRGAGSSRRHPSMHLYGTMFIASRAASTAMWWTC